MYLVHAPCHALQYVGLNLHSICRRVGVYHLHLTHQHRVIRGVVDSWVKSTATWCTNVLCCTIMAMHLFHVCQCNCRPHLCSDGTTLLYSGPFLIQHVLIQYPYNFVGIYGGVEPKLVLIQDGSALIVILQITSLRFKCQSKGIPF